jgi:hypothetical protein
MKIFFSKFQQRDKKFGWLLFSLIFLLQILTILGNMAAQDRYTKNTAQSMMQIQSLTLCKKML